MDKKIKRIVIAFIAVVCLATAVSLTFYFTVSANWPRLRTGRTLVVSKGTAVQMDSLYLPEDIHMVIKAKNANTGIVYLGYSSATADYTSTTTHFTLYPGEAVRLKVYNANQIWLDGESGEGIEFITEYD